MNSLNVTGKEVWQRVLANNIAKNLNVECVGISFAGDDEAVSKAESEFEAKVNQIAAQWAEKVDSLKVLTRTFRWNPIKEGKSKYERHPAGKCSDWDFMTTSQRRSARVKFCATSVAAV